jgi:hypothetical protein
MASLKITLHFEIDEEQLRDIFESYDIKPTKKKIAQLKRDMKESEADNIIADNLSSDIENEIGDWINGMDWED